MLIDKLKGWARKLKNDLKVIYLAYQDKRTPWYAKVLTALVLTYALSPIDLIPDFIPLLGYLDDLILVPIGIYLIIKMIPQQVIGECRIKAQNFQWDKKQSWLGAILIIAFWAALLFWILNIYNINIP